MSRRKEFLATGQYYHIYNRGVEKRTIFGNTRDYRRFIELLNFYQRLRNFKFSSLTRDERQEVIQSKKGQALIKINCYCLMPNHFHLILQQLTDNGIARYMRFISNSYAHYFNIKNDRVGPLFQNPFQTVRIEKDVQLLQTNRYIHINPAVAYLIQKSQDYPWSSYKEYLGLEQGFCSKSIVLDQFPSVQNYKEFCEDQADYARNLEKINHLLIEDQP